MIRELLPPPGRTRLRGYAGEGYRLVASFEENEDAGLIISAHHFARYTR